MAKVITLTGMSASGKDAILKGVISRSSIKPVISTTSRPIRKGETDGVEYHFVSKEQAEKKLYNHEFIEVREYYVANGDRWLYGITKDSIDIDSNDTYIAIVDYDGLKQLNKYLDRSNVEHYSYYLNVNYQDLLLRSLQREGNMCDLQVEEVVRRFKDDLENVQPAKFYVDKVLDNNTIEELNDNIQSILIKGMLMENDQIRKITRN